MTHSRRSFFTGLATLIAAPAIVRAESLMRLAPTKISRISIRELDVLIAYSIAEPVTQLYDYAQIRPEWTAIVPDLSLSLDEYSRRILAPMVKRLEQSVADTMLHGNGAAWMTFEANGTGSLPKGVREQIPVIALIRLSDLLREAQGHQFT